MPVLVRSEFAFGDILVRYQAPEDRPEAVGLCLAPLDLVDSLINPREHLDGPSVVCLPEHFLPIRAWEVDPLVHVSRLDDPAGSSYTQGRTMRGGASTRSLQFSGQNVLRENGTTTIRSTLSDGRGLECEHELIARSGSGCLQVRTTAGNVGETPIRLGLLTSFSLGGITPFAADDAPERLRIHRFRSSWSAEARLLSESIEDLQLDPAWIPHGVRSLRFGQVGSLPTNGWFPFLAVEDSGAGVTWAAQIAHPGSWQFELWRRADQLAISGGQADREFGHWVKTLEPGESFSSPAAFLTVVRGGLDDACERITRHLDAGAKQRAPEIETKLPVVFNEWCTTWGNPSHANLLPIAERLRDSGVTYLVIDDGWAQREGPGVQQNGDWILNGTAFPKGLKATADEIRKCGLIPGIWFEFEVLTPGSKAWEETSHVLHRDGTPLQVGHRRFWDFRDPWVHEFLADRVIALLRDNNLGYLKIDYNDTIGFGCDGAESPGEGLRQHLEGVQRFLRSIREALPDIVIENCASGGHRLEPSMMALSSMSSFSDAHETPDIPVIAANLLRLIPARQNQIWAVLRSADSMQRLSYSLAATFLGRMCLSGDVELLGETEWAFVREGVALYRDVAPMIAEGRWRRHGEWSQSYRQLRGWQAVVCCTESPDRTLVVWHRFGGEAAECIVPVPPVTSKIVRNFSDSDCDAHVEGDRLCLHLDLAWSGGVLVLEA